MVNSACPSSDAICLPRQASPGFSIALLRNWAWSVNTDPASENRPSRYCTPGSTENHHRHPNHPGIQIRAAGPQRRDNGPPDRPCPGRRSGPLGVNGRPASPSRSSPPSRPPCRSPPAGRSIRRSRRVNVNSPICTSGLGHRGRISAFAITRRFGSTLGVAAIFASTLSRLASIAVKGVDHLPLCDHSPAPPAP